MVCQMNLFDNVFTIYLLHIAAGAVLTALLTKAAIRILPRLQMIDIPRGRHQHEVAVPRGGGVAIWAAFFAVVASLGIYTASKGLPVAAEIRTFLRIFSIPALILLVVGLIDDRFELRSVVKLICQIIVGVIFYLEGCGITLLFGHTLPAVLSLAVTVVWCVVIINAFNLIDGLDGLAAGLGAISSFLLAAWSWISGYNSVMVLIPLCFGMCNLGFLRYNFSPAKIFMGDTGSMFIGLFFAFLSMQHSTKSVTFTALLVPLAAVGVPIFDVFLAVWRRGMRKYIQKDGNTAIMQGDHDHLHHRILKETGKTGRTALIIYGLAIMLSLLAMLNEFLRTSFPTLVFLMLLIGFATVIRYSNIELYDTLSSVAKGVKVPHRNFLLGAVHPALDTLLVLLAIFISSRMYGGLLPFEWISWWYLLFLAPFVLVLCFSGIYRTFWLRAGILQYYKLIRLLVVAGILGYILNGAIWYFAMGLDRAGRLAASGYYLIFWMFAAGLILGERFLLHYFESFGYRRLFIRNQGRNSKMPRILIYGGGLSCRMYVSSVYCSFSTGVEAVRIIGIMDDNPALTSLNIYGFKVHGGIDRIETIWEDTHFDKVVIACENLQPENFEKLKKFCSEKQVELKKFICTEKKM